MATEDRRTQFLGGSHSLPYPYRPMHTPSRGAETRPRIHPRIRPHKDRQNKAGFDQAPFANSLVATADRRTQLLGGSHSHPRPRSQCADFPRGCDLRDSTRTTFKASSFVSRSLRCRGRAVSLVPSVSLPLTFLSRFAAPLRPNPVFHSALKLFLPSLHSSLSYTQSHGCTEPNHFTVLSFPEGISGTLRKAHSSRNCTKQSPTSLHARSNVRDITPCRNRRHSA